MLEHLRPSLVMVGLFTAVTGLAYPLLTTGVAGAVMPRQATGSLIKDASGQVRGSYLIAQAFAGPGYLHPRPSAAGDKGYDAASSSGSNLGPMDPKLADRVKKDAAALAAEAPGAMIPADAVTTSGSGLDPDITPANAALQAPRIARARKIDVGEVSRLIATENEPPVLGFIGQRTINVLKVNEALDRTHPLHGPKG